MKTIYCVIFIFCIGLPLIAAIISCNQNIDGGSCTYNTILLPAEVIAIIPLPYDSTRSDILFKITDSTGNIYRDSVSWSMKTKGYLNNTQIIKDSITIGKKYTYTISKILTGHCDPDIEILELKKFK